MEKLTQEFINYLDNYVDENQQELSKWSGISWFLHNGKNLIRSNVDHMYASNIGNNVIRLHCPAYYKKEEVVDYLKMLQYSDLHNYINDNDNSEIR